MSNCFTHVRRNMFNGQTTYECTFIFDHNYSNSIKYFTITPPESQQLFLITQ